MYNVLTTFFYNNTVTVIKAFFFFLEVARLFGPPTSQPLDIDGNPLLQAGSLASQLCPLGPKERCTPSQAQAMGQQVLGLMALHESNGTSMPCERNYDCSVLYC